MTSYTLTRSEQAIARWLARERTRRNRQVGAVNKKVGPQSQFETELAGVAGELAFARLANLYPDLTTEPRRGSADCRRNGRRIDVKCTSYESGRLLVHPSKRADDADVYVLVVGSFPGPYRWAGWVWASEILRPDRLGDLGHGPVYLMDQDELRPPTNGNGRGRR